MKTEAREERFFVLEVGANTYYIRGRSHPGSFSTTGSALVATRMDPELEPLGTLKKTFPHARFVPIVARWEEASEPEKHTP